MILAVGTDLVDVERLGQRLERCPALASRLLTQRERDLCGARLASVAARVAAKEAVLKALGSALAQKGHGAPPGWTLHDVEIVSAPGSAPRLEVSGVCARTARDLGVARWHVSLSHDAGLALAWVVAEGA